MKIMAVSVFVVAMTALTTAFQTTELPPSDAGGTGDPWEYFHTTVPPTEPTELPPSDAGGTGDPSEISDTTVPTTEEQFGGWHPSCPPGWTMFQYHCLLFVKELKTWAEAETNCHHQGGNIVSVVHYTVGVDMTKNIQELLGDAGHHDVQIWIQECSAQYPSEKSSCLLIGEGNPPTGIPPPRTTVPHPPTSIPPPQTTVPLPPTTIPTRPTTVPLPPTTIPPPPTTVPPGEGGGNGHGDPLPSTTIPPPPTTVPHRSPHKDGKKKHKFGSQHGEKIVGRFGGRGYKLNRGYKKDGSSPELGERFGGHFRAGNGLGYEKDPSSSKHGGKHGGGHWHRRGRSARGLGGHGEGGGSRVRRSPYVPSGCSTNEQCPHRLLSVCSILIF